MNSVSSKTLSLILLVWLPCFGSQVSAAPHLDDPNRIATIDSKWVYATETRLSEVEAKSGIRIILQFHARSPTNEEDAVPGAYMKGIAKSLGIAESGVLIVYFADDPDWRIWIGDNLAPQFANRSGSVAELTANQAIHNAKEAYLTSSIAKGDAEFNSARTPAIVSRRIDLEGTAMIENLCSRLGIK